MKQNQKCEICGELATCVTQDIAEVTNCKRLGAIWKEYEPFGNPHYYCEKHYISPDIIDLRCGHTSQQIKNLMNLM